MIYETEAHAIQAAAEANQFLGHPRAWVCLTPFGWTVISGWSKPTSAGYSAVYGGNVPVLNVSR